MQYKLPFSSGTDRLRRISKEGIWVVIGQGLAVAGSLVGVRVLTELLDAAAYGELALGMTLALLINQTLFGPLSTGVTRFYAPALEESDLAGYFIAIRRLVFLATILICILVLLVTSGLLITGNGEWIWLALVAQIYAAFSGITTTMNGIWNAARRRKIVALHQAMQAFIRVLIALGLVLWLGRTSAVAMAAYAIATALVLGSQVVFFRKQTALVHENTIPLSQSKIWEKRMLNFSWPVATWGIFSWIQMASDRWALEIFTTTELVGLYAVLIQLGHYPMMMLGQLAMQLLAPIFYQKSGAADDRNRNANVSALNWRLTSASLVITGVIFLIALYLHGGIFRVLVADSYASVSYLLPWMLFAGGLFSAGQTLALNLMSRLQTKKMIVVKISTALLGVVFNFAGAYVLGIVGIVMANVLFSIVYFLWMLVVVRQSE